MIVYDRMKLHAELKRDEGLRLKPYRDTLGVLTIGYGRNLAKGISVDEAKLLLENDIEEAEGVLDNVLPNWRGFSDTRQRVLLNMAFNLGERKLAGFKRMFAALLRNNFDGAAAEMLMSKWASQVGPRAQRLAKMIRKG